MEKYFFEYILGLLMDNVAVEEEDGALNIVFHKGTNFEMRYENVNRGAYSFPESEFDIKEKAEILHTEAKIDEEELSYLREFDVKVKDAQKNMIDIVELSAWNLVRGVTEQLNGELEFCSQKAHYWHFGNVNLYLKYDPEEKNPLEEDQREIYEILKGLSKEKAEELKSDIEILTVQWPKCMRLLEKEVISMLMHYHKQFEQNFENEEIAFTNSDGTKQVMKNYREIVDIEGEKLSAEVLEEIKMMKIIASLIMAD